MKDKLVIIMRNLARLTSPNPSILLLVALVVVVLALVVVDGRMADVALSGLENRLGVFNLEGGARF